MQLQSTLIKISIPFLCNIMFFHILQGAYVENFQKGLEAGRRLGAGRRFDYRFANLRDEDLRNGNFFRCSLYRANLDRSNCDEVSFRRAGLQEVSAQDASFRYASFRWADLENANLTNSDFTGAYFLCAILTNTVARGADFDKVRGLTNEQKDYLRANGALNVPPNLTQEEFEKETKQVNEELKPDWIVRCFDAICDFLTLGYFKEKDMTKSS